MKYWICFMLCWLVMNSGIALAFQYDCSKGKTVISVESVDNTDGSCVVKMKKGSGQAKVVAKANKTPRFCSEKADAIVRKLEKVSKFQCAFLDDTHFEKTN